MAEGLILLVEDDPSIQEVIQQILEIEGYQVRAASNGRTALGFLQKDDLFSHVNLILLDLMMPVMSGWEFLEERKLCGWLANIPVVLLSAFHEKAADLCVAGVLPKPVEIDVLLSMVQDQVRKLG